MKKIAKFLISIVILVIVWSIMMKVDSKRAEENKLPLFAIDVVTNEYENGKITQYISIGYQVVEYQLENKNNVIEFQNSFFVPDTETLVDKYLEEKNGKQEDADKEESTDNESENKVGENTEKTDTENKNNSTKENDIAEETYTVTHY